MTPCARGCCWSPYGCGKANTCDCHPTPLTEWLGTSNNEPPVRLGHRDPTANQAIANFMRAERGKGK